MCACWISFSFNGGELGASLYERDLKQVKFKYPCPESNTVCSPINVIVGAGYYKFECIGAAGGSGRLSPGGFGGYSVGVINFSHPTSLFIYVGGKGSTVSSPEKAISKGGFNGGGEGIVGRYELNAGGGGGATDIRVSLDSLSNRVIVGGGGGGSIGYSSTEPDGLGGNGGGEIGSSGTSQEDNIYFGTGGSQSSPGICNDNGNGTPGLNNTGGNGASLSSSGGGGGGGYYGGGGGKFAGGGGGSGFVGLMLSSRGIEKKTTSFSNNDNGYAVITLLSTSPCNERCTSNCYDLFSIRNLMFIFQQILS